MVKDFITNEQRRYLGLEPIESGWDVVAYKNRQNHKEINYLVYDGDIIRKLIRISESYYEETQLHEQTAENRSLLLPKTKRGKPKVMNFAATQTLRGIGCYFYVSHSVIDIKRCFFLIANYTTQQTYIYEKFQGSGKIYDDIQEWLKRWIADTTEMDLTELDQFKNAQLTHQKYKSGDFFTFRLNRREWGFGRILMVVSELMKDPHFIDNKNYGLIHIMGYTLIVQVYHKIALSPTVSPEELKNLPALPAQAVADNEFYYGEHPIIGHLPISPEEYEPLISLGHGLSNITNQIVYLQYGIIYKETTKKEFLKVFPDFDFERFRNEGSSFRPNTDFLRECIAEHSNEPFWKNNKIKGILSDTEDLRNPRYAVLKHRLFAFFGLDAEKNYAENLKAQDSH